MSGRVPSGLAATFSALQTLVLFHLTNVWLYYSVWFSVSVSIPQEETQSQFCFKIMFSEKIGTEEIVNRQCVTLCQNWVVFKYILEIGAWKWEM